MKKYFLITGASSEIGQEIAYELAKEGYNLYLHYFTNEQSIKDLYNRIEPFQGEYIPIQANLSNKQGIDNLINNIFSINGIIHATGVTKYEMLMDLSEEDIEKQLFVNLHSPILITRALLTKITREMNSKIIFIASIWGQTGASCETVYSAAKGGQIAFMKALSKEISYSKTTVNAIAPGVIDTKMIHHLEEEERQLLLEEIPLNRLGLPGEVANGVKYLISEQANYITGQVLSINGGWYI